MEPNKQIDYGTLEWFDCKNNFPPMNINLYVDSEHGYGIGRLGKRVKDRSIIWDVQLDSGEVYLVYAFYKVKRWAYIPKDEKTNTKLKHELMLNKDMSWVPCYLKSDVDKQIEELKENHKKEVEQLLMKIAGLEKLVETADKLLKPKGGFTIKDVTFGGVELEGIKTHKKEEAK